MMTALKLCEELLRCVLIPSLTFFRLRQTTLPDTKLTSDSTPLGLLASSHALSCRKYQDVLD